MTKPDRKIISTVARREKPLYFQADNKVMISTVSILNKVYFLKDE